MKTEVRKFKNRPVLMIFDETKDKYKALMAFGLKKARAILEVLDEIKKFVKENE